MYVYDPVIVLTFGYFLGFVFNYNIQQIPLWGLIHAVFLVWVVRDPFGYRRSVKNGRMRYAHIISVVLAVVIPLFGPCILLRDGYVVTSFPSLVCVGRNLDVTYYTIILPVCLIAATMSSLLLVFFWTMFKVHRTTDSYTCSYITKGLYKN